MKSYFVFIKFIPLVFLIIVNTTVFAAKYNFTDHQKEEEILNLLETYPAKGSIRNNYQKQVVTDKKEQFKLIYEHLSNKELEPARKELDKILLQYPDEPRFINLLALLNTLDKDYFSAESNYLRTLTLQPDNVIAMLGLAKLNLAENKLDKAQQYVDKAMSINDQLFKTYLLAADIANARKNIEGIEKILVQGLAKNSGHIDAEIIMINALKALYISLNQTDKMLEITQNLVDNYPSNAKALTTQAKALILNDKLDQAEQILKAQISRNQQDILSHMLLAGILDKSANKSSEVIKLVDTVLEIQPKHFGALILKSNAHLRLKQNKLALDSISSLENLYPEQAVTKKLRGDLSFSEQKLTEALESFQQSYQIKADNKVLARIVYVLKNTDKTQEAVTLLQQELDKNPKNNFIHLELAGIFLQSQDYANAEKHYQAILTNFPNHVLALNNLAWMYMEQDKPEALTMAKSAYEKAPQVAQIADTYGLILIKHEQPKLALEILTKAVTTAPNMGDIQYHLALAYEANNNKVQAVKILKKLEQDKIEFGEKQEASDLLRKLQN